MQAPHTDDDVPRAAGGAAARLPAIEWPTVALLVACYACWLVLTAAYGDLPLWLLAPGVAVTLAFHSSLQHELVHGHPTRSKSVNCALGIAPLSLWIPYERYRVLHLKHHVNDRLTDPFDDPESNYLTPEAWRALPAFKRGMRLLQQTLAGRTLIGSWWRVGTFLRREVRALLADEPGVRAAWALHVACVLPVGVWVVAYCGIPLWLYFVAMVVPGNALLLIRSFAEHRARGDRHERTATVENSWVLGPLFLFNNLHSLHHDEPALPWYRYNARYRLVRNRLLAQSGDHVYSTYFDVARRYLFRPHDRVEHPTGRVPPRFNSVIDSRRQGVAGGMRGTVPLERAGVIARVDSGESVGQ